MRQVRELVERFEKSLSNWLIIVNLSAVRLVPTFNFLSLKPLPQLPESFGAAWRIIDLCPFTEGEKTLMELGVVGKLPRESRPRS